MKNICALIDFTEASKLAVSFACEIANRAGGKLQLLHVKSPMEKRTVDEMAKVLAEFVDLRGRCKTDFEMLIDEGEFEKMIPVILKKHKAELVVIATHGVKGIFHTMQGPEVLRLVQKIEVPSIILQHQTPKEFLEFKTILFPIASHSNFQVKIDQTANIAELFSSKVQIFVLTPEKGDLEEALLSNLKKVEDTFTKRKISYEIIREPSKVYGIGYARQALEYVGTHPIDLFSIMAHASEEHSYFGNIERSEFILNKAGIPVLCCT